MASPDWVLDSLLGFLQSPFWNVAINSFIDHNCVVFDPGEENKFTYTDIHREYATLVEGMLEGFVEDFQITSDQFVDACARGLASDDIDEKLLECVFAADDFLMFKSIMVKRNIELDLQVIEMVKRAQAERKQAAPQPQPEQAPDPAATSKEEEEYDEEKVLQEVMRRSMAEFQQEQRAKTDAEMARMLEAAQLESVRLFEAMQAEEEQMARLLQATLALSQLANKESLHGEPSQTVTRLEQARALGSAEQDKETLEPREAAETMPELALSQQPQLEEQPRSIWEACLSTPPVGGASDGTDGNDHGSTMGHSGGGTGSVPVGGGTGSVLVGGGTGSVPVGGGGTGSVPVGGGGTGSVPVGGGGTGSVPGGGGGTGSVPGGGGGTGSVPGGGGGTGNVPGGGGGTGSVPGGVGGAGSVPVCTRGDGNEVTDPNHILVSPESVATKTKTQQNAAAAWLESAKNDAEQESRAKWSTELIPVDPDPENREAYWRLQKNRLLALKKEERTRQMQTTEAVAHGYKLSQTAEVAQKVVKDPTGGSGGTSEKEERRQTLLTALANRLKKEASDATQPD